MLLTKAVSASRIAAAAFPFIFAILIGSRCRAAEIAPNVITVDQARAEIRFRASVHPDAMYLPFGIHGHHAIVSRSGRASRWALFKAEAGDLEIRQALDRIGARPGENLPAASWTERENKSSAAPSLRVEGTPLEILISWDGRAPVPLASLLDPRQGNSFDFRYGGNQRHRSEFRSGCIVCLYSCPGGAIGNRNKTIRDWVNEGPVYSARKAALPRRGSSVTITIRKKAEVA